MLSDGEGSLLEGEGPVKSDEASGAFDSLRPFMGSCYLTPLAHLTFLGELQGIYHRQY
jgi:hypothetical protein